MFHVEQIRQKRMPNNKKSLEPFALTYRNGTTSSESGVPHYADICLARDSQTECDDLIEAADTFRHVIRSEKECQDYIALHTLVEEALQKLAKLANHDRKPIVAILSQISAAIEPAKTSLLRAAGELKAYVTQWREQEVVGALREEERLRVQAEEKRNEAKYTNDPVKARKATVQAKQLDKEADEIAPKPQKGGVDTEEYWEATIQNRVQAAKLPENIVSMDIDQTELNKHIRSLRHAGQKITPNILPGLAIERKTRLRFHK